MYRRTLFLVGCILAVAICGIGVPLSMRFCREPIDVGGSTSLPEWLNTLKQRDELAYPAHVAVGFLLEQAQCAPVAGGLQWLKAGAHARTKQEVATVGRGLATARARSERAEAFDAALCTFAAAGFARLEQEAAARVAGVACP